MQKKNNNWSAKVVTLGIIYYYVQTSYTILSTEGQYSVIGNCYY